MAETHKSVYRACRCSVCSNLFTQKSIENKMEITLLLTHGHNRFHRRSSLEKELWHKLTVEVHVCGFRTKFSSQRLFRLVLVICLEWFDCKWTFTPCWLMCTPKHFFCARMLFPTDAEGRVTLWAARCDQISLLRLLFEKMAIHSDLNYQYIIKLTLIQFRAILLTFYFGM